MLMLGEILFVLFAIYIFLFKSGDDHTDRG